MTLGVALERTTLAVISVPSSSTTPQARLLLSPVVQLSPVVVCMSFTGCRKKGRGRGGGGGGIRREKHYLLLLVVVVVFCVRVFFFVVFFLVILPA